MPGIPREGIQAAINSIIAVLNGLSAKHLDSTTAFDIRGGPGGAIALLYTIDDGLRAEELRQKRLKQGVLEEDDLKPRNL